ncbi:MAG: DUF3857 and transglutaminase domain-containing protein [Candidatus Zixiibacteriota bacterium]
MQVRKWVPIVLVMLAAAPAAFALDSTEPDLVPANCDSIIKQSASAPDSSSFPCIKLLDQVEVNLVGRSTYTQTIHQIELIRNSQGVEMLGTAVISYVEGNDSVFILTARSIDPDGQTYDVPEDQIMRGIVPSNLMENDLYTDQRQVRINFHGLRIGSVCELKYRIKRYRPTFDGFSIGYIFESAVPCRLAVVAVQFPDSLPFYSKVYGDKVAFSESSTDGRHLKVWRMDNIRELLVEPGSLPPLDIGTRVELSNYASWQEFAAMYHDSLWAPDLGALLDSTEQAILAEFRLEHLPKSERVRVIYNWVQSQIRYLGLEMGVNNIKPHPSALICRKRYGDCKDMSNLLVKFLRASGIAAYPAMVSTTSLKNDDQFAAIRLMNHVIVYVPKCDDQELWLDPTLNYAPFGTLSPAVVNHMAVILTSAPTIVPRIPFSALRPNLQLGAYFVTVDSRGIATESGLTSFSGIIAAILKGQFARMSRPQANKFVESVAGPSTHLSKIHLAGLGSSDSSLSIELEGIDSTFVSMAGDLMIIDAKASEIRFDASRGLESRYTDLYLGLKLEFGYKRTITYPASYKIKSLPENTTITSEFFNYRKVFTVLLDHRIQISEDASITEPYVPVAKYPEYRAAIGKMTAASREKIVLKRR